MNEEIFKKMVRETLENNVYKMVWAVFEDCIIDDRKGTYWIYGLFPPVEHGGKIEIEGPITYGAPGEKGAKYDFITYFEGDDVAYEALRWTEEDIKTREKELKEKEEYEEISPVEEAVGIVRGLLWNLDEAIRREIPEMVKRAFKMGPVPPTPFPS